MSMKRARRASSTGKNQQAEAPFAFASAPPPPPTWEQATKEKPDEAFKPYAMTTSFARDDLVAHPKFGRGVVTMVEGSRVEILFQDGPRKLSHAG